MHKGKANPTNQESAVSLKKLSTVVQSPAKAVGSRKNSIFVPKKLITKKKIVPAMAVVKQLKIEDFD